MVGQPLLRGGIRRLERILLRSHRDGVKIAVSKTGRISGYVIIDGKRVRISAKCFSEFSDGVYRASGTVKGGTFSLEVSKAGLSCTVVKGDATTSISAQR